MSVLTYNLTTAQCKTIDAAVDSSNDMATMIAASFPQLKQQERGGFVLAVASRIALRYTTHKACPGIMVAYLSRKGGLPTFGIKMDDGTTSNGGEYKSACTAAAALMRRSFRGFAVFGSKPAAASTSDAERFAATLDKLMDTLPTRQLDKLMAERGFVRA
jgi:hypothetical protein